MMKGRFIGLCVIGLVLVCFTGVALAYQPIAGKKVSKTATVTPTGTVTLTVEVADMTGAVVGGDIGWDAVALPMAGATTWKAANRCLKLTYLFGMIGAPAVLANGIEIYTDNANGVAPYKYTGIDSNPAGLVSSDGKAFLASSWRVTDDVATASQINIYEKLLNEADIETTSGLELVNGAAGIQAGVTYDVNGDGDTLDYISLLSDQANAYLTWNPAEANPKKIGRYTPWIWELDKKQGDAAKTPAGEGSTYSTVITAGDGIQHAENSWGTWAGSPIFVGIGANFKYAQAGVTYGTNTLTVEMYNY